MLKLVIPLKPVSVNAAYRPVRRNGFNGKMATISSKEHSDYLKEATKVIRIGPYNKKEKHPEYYLFLIHRLKRFSNSDGHNFEKVTTDFLVERGQVPDDKYATIFSIKKPLDERGLELTEAYFTFDKTEFIECLSKLL